jgi:hypothetical protein
MPQQIFGRFDGKRNSGCRLRQMIIDGLLHVSFENEHIRFLICVDKGCDIVEFVHKPSDTEMLFQMPAGLPKPTDRFSSPLEEGVFRDLFTGGWYVMIPNGPEPCMHRNVRYGFHGEATQAAWACVPIVDRRDLIVVDFHVRLRRTPLLVERRISLAADSGTFTINEAVTNEAGHATEILWGHHPTFGETLLAGPIAIDMPIDAVISDGPHLKNELCGTISHEAKISDFHRIQIDGAGWMAIRNIDRKVGVALRWDETLFPMAGVWRMLEGADDYPWWRNKRMLAIEPACDLPSLAKAAERGTAICLAPGERKETKIEATAFTSTLPVQAVDWGGKLDFSLT